MCLVKRKQYFVTIVLQIIKKTKRNILAFIINSHSNWKKAMERFTSYDKSRSMEAVNISSIKYVPNKQLFITFENF